ncbi:MAG: coproporphyrinogen oxidase, anaerobic [Phycisphaerales bacterium]|nr:coproporphyrinogen oxidase, anaerobic [Phycisphaerales bacterium]
MPRTLDLLTDRVDLSPAELPAARIDALYVHVPFCFHKCHYCDFYSITRQTPERMDRFVDLLLTEADLWSAQRPRPSTIFFGGGTPSLLPLKAMRRLLTGLHDRLDLSAVDEWTIEVNPATADGDYLRMLRDAGVNRLSFGAQSFDLAELKTLERHHEPADVERSISLAREAGFERLNLDLIYAIPGQTMASWQRSLEAALALGVSHLSCYGLTYEPNTVIAVRKRLGRLTAIEDDVELQMLHVTRKRLAEAGFEAYEISNYAQTGQACRHNLAYWTGKNYIGLGPSAASHVDGHRFKNRQHLGDWESAVPGGSLPVVEHEILSADERIEERLMLELRLGRGVRWADYLADLRDKFATPLSHLKGLGLIAVDSDGFRLTEQGIDVADGVAAEFFAR